MPCKQDSGQKILTNTLPQFIQSHTSFFQVFQRNHWSSFWGWGCNMSRNEGQMTETVRGQLLHNLAELFCDLSFWTLKRQNNLVLNTSSPALMMVKKARDCDSLGTHEKKLQRGLHAKTTPCYNDARVTMSVLLYASMHRVSLLKGKWWGSRFFQTSQWTKVTKKYSKFFWIIFQNCYIIFDFKIV